MAVSDVQSRKSGRHAVARATRIGRFVIRNPHEAADRGREIIAQWQDKRIPSWPYEVADDAEERIHRLLGAAWPCPDRDEYAAVRTETLDDLAARGVNVGRGSFASWDDGDVWLGRVAWCLTRHLRPQRIVETGVARGLTTRAILEALTRNDRGHLWSIDLPPLLDRSVDSEIAAAVPERLYPRWSLLQGSSRRLLPQLVSDLGQVNLFVHDSMHTGRNLAFELSQIWPALAPTGVALVDDVEKNAATGRFLRAHPNTAGVISAATDGQVLIGCLVKSPERHPTSRTASLGASAGEPVQKAP